MNKINYIAKLQLGGYNASFKSKKVLFC